MESIDSRRCKICLFPLLTTAVELQEARLRRPVLPDALLRERGARAERYFDIADLQLSAARGCLSCAFFCNFASDTVLVKNSTGDFTESCRLFFGTAGRSLDPSYVAWDFKDDRVSRQRTNLELFSLSEVGASKGLFR
jgi:hypothetical protein